MDASLHAFINAGIEALWPVGDRYGEATGVPYLTYKVVITILHGQFVIRKPAACFQAHNVDSRLDSTSTVIEILSLSASQARNPHLVREIRSSQPSCCLSLVFRGHGRFSLRNENKGTPLIVPRTGRSFPVPIYFSLTMMTAV